MTSINQKALILPEKLGAFTVASVDIPKPKAGEVLIKILSAGLNPVDWEIQKTGWFITEWPTILGSDIAGEVVELGEGVSDFSKGDRVFYHGEIDNNARGGFQQFGIAGTDTLGKIPRELSYDQAATIPLAFTTSYLALYNSKPHGFELEPPVSAASKGRYAGEPIVILGGSSSVGQFGIQLASLSGFNPIITTASLRHEEFLKSLGATHVLDRTVPLTIDRIGTITTKPIRFVYDTISIAETQEAGLNILTSGGILVLTLLPIPSVEEKASKESKSAVYVLAKKTLPENIKILGEMWPQITDLFEGSDIKPNRFEVLPDGLNGVAEGLNRLQQDKVSGIKLVSHPQETI